MPFYPVQSTMVGYLVASLQTISFTYTDVHLAFELRVANTAINKRLKTLELKLLPVYIKQKRD